MSLQRDMYRARREFEVMTEIFNAKEKRNLKLVRERARIIKERIAGNQSDFADGLEAYMVGTYINSPISSTSTQGYGQPPCGSDPMKALLEDAGLPLDEESQIPGKVARELVGELLYRKLASSVKRTLQNPVNVRKRQSFLIGIT